MEKKIVLVTGGSRGIGRGIVKLLAHEGYTVIANYKQSDDKANSLKQELQNDGIEIDIYKADVSVRSEVKNMIEYIINKYHSLDVIVNNAGIDQEKMLQDITDEDFNEVIKNNLYSVFCVTQEGLPHMISNHSGCIINISSIYGVTGGSCASVYSATKARNYWIY